MHLAITALDLRTAEKTTFDTCHYCLGGGHILATVSHNVEILGLHWWSVADYISDVLYLKEFPVHVGES